MSPGDLVLVPFPHAQKPGVKKRPALVLGVIDDGPDDDLIVVQCTSAQGRINNPMVGDIVTDDPAFPKESVVRCRNIFTLRETMVDHSFGTVEPALLRQATEQTIALIS